MVIGAALIVTVVTVVWTAAGETDECTGAQTMVCSTAGRYILAFVPTGILLAGGLGAFVHAYRAWRTGGTWPIWHGTGWALLVFMLIYLGISARVLAGT
ncbi:hypothetical protein ACH47B_37555 [Rhodococcus sp. NPDC019627]|uniref:hypothetical protein n=1 Tax=unclassified Rhodococcus (in: high G+C Gram-positive bacteria) TaxID=192944 RepID=UPI0034016806